jgi:hypothetical protein
MGRVNRVWGSAVIHQRLLPCATLICHSGEAVLARGGGFVRGAPRKCVDRRSQTLVLRRSAYGLTAATVM